MCIQTLNLYIRVKKTGFNITPGYITGDESVLSSSQYYDIISPGVILNPNILPENSPLK